VFTRFWIINDQVHGADLTTPFAELLDPDLADRLKAETETASELTSTLDSPDGQPGSHEMPDRAETLPLVRTCHTEAHSPFNGKRPAQTPSSVLTAPPWETLNPGLLPQDQGLNFETLVELRGIEPLTF
jgi:site-specific DNA recombinase